MTSRGSLDPDLPIAIGISLPSEVWAGERFGHPIDSGPLAIRNRLAAFFWAETTIIDTLFTGPETVDCHVMR